jgi:hypothetical protein
MAASAVTSPVPLPLRSAVRRRLQAAVIPALLGSGLAIPLPQAQAGLLTPVLQLMRPQLEIRLAEVCLETVAGTNPELRRSLQEPCHKLAGPTSRCLVEETDGSGQGLGVLSELIGGRFGEASEGVVKRCLARLFGLPADSLREVPLRDLGRRFAPRQGPTAEAR